MGTKTLHIVAFVQPDKVVHRTIEYEEKAKTLVAIEMNDERAVPIGLRRVKLSSLPKVGGLFGTTTVGRTEAEARELLLRVLKEKEAHTARELRSWQNGIDLLTREW